LHVIALFLEIFENTYSTTMVLLLKSLPIFIINKNVKSLSIIEQRFFFSRFAHLDLATFYKAFKGLESLSCSIYLPLFLLNIFHVFKKRFVHIGNQLHFKNHLICHDFKTYMLIKHIT
jgi:hypothetical protein